MNELFDNDGLFTGPVKYQTPLEWRMEVQPYTNLSSTFRISYFSDKKTDGKGYTDVLFISDIQPDQLHTKINEVLTLPGVWAILIYAEQRNNPDGGN